MSWNLTSAVLLLDFFNRDSCQFFFVGIALEKEKHSIEIAEIEKKIELEDFEEERRSIISFFWIS